MLPAPRVPVGPETALRMPPTVARDSNCTSSGHTRVAACALRPPTHRRFPWCPPPLLSPVGNTHSALNPRHLTNLCCSCGIPRQPAAPDTPLRGPHPQAHCSCAQRDFGEKRGEASAAGSSARSGGGLAVVSAELRVQGYAAVRSLSGFAVHAIARSRASLVFRTGSNWGWNSRRNVVEFFHGARSTRQTYQRERMESVAARTWHLYRRGDKNGRADASNMEAGFRASVSTASRCGKLRRASPSLCGRIWCTALLLNNPGLRESWAGLSHTLASLSPLPSDVVRPHRLQARDLSKGEEKSHVARVDSYHDRERPAVWMGHHVEMIMTSLEISRTQLDPMKMTVARLQMVIALWLAREMTGLETAIERDTSSIVESLEQLAAIRDLPLDP
ncbi:hypothetical protein BKA93DRAFT_753179 [Sparassis latifolia]